MSQLISKCPGCQGNLQIATLKCPDCGLELKNTFELSCFDRLDPEQSQFLLAFLKARGNLSEVQSEMKSTYLTVKRKLDDLLAALDLGASRDAEKAAKLDPSKLEVDYTSSRASEMIKAKLKEHGGHATVYTARGLPCEIYAEADGKTFTSDKLPVKPAYDYGVFDVIVDLLVTQGGRARKGNGRNFKLGDPGCEETTVVGAIAKYRGRKPGESVFDPVFVMAAVLEWAGVVKNGRGELILSEEYNAAIRQSAEMPSGASAAPVTEALAQAFESELRQKAQAAQRECGYSPTLFLRMLNQHGGVKTAKILIHSGIKNGQLSDGFKRLCMCHRSDLTMEDSVCKSDYAPLFTSEEIAYCKHLLEGGNQVSGSSN